ncbi:MAG: hypothetical protein A2745_00280 [Candidatus Harrisonbacteria bacterium RIFCSPHIGHO2_01_FULL_44_13]|uniref:Uncharacterized protein n=1 Tax=Candidatus Harrisonbacteria bacterium RIFCSPLOWO2_01_FULL_44_18 TaxID=1798407 RepID=A0A1G1ZL25_9BACT|nr:MAG: hypothetical protein A2745_00280 [Candidatus Harrisonbacteria bacterium RIFCSPHIGHO2_01_FULL_44_13]OGY65343.1 MAG: hypothetical protein A3A16_02755 [Candidatus Harrisonbacteria bacterium RIFCSPLOWO2_01_FULL_44_18]
MKYLNPNELPAARNDLRNAWDEGGGSDIVVQGRALALFHARVRKDFRILDIGCGNGFFAEQLRRDDFWEVFGYDAGDYATNERKKYFREFKVGNINFEMLPWPDDFFDAVSAWQVIEHLENPHHFIREVNRVLKPGGIFFLSTPNIFNIFNRLIFLKSGDMPRWQEKNDHIALFPKGVFKKTVLKYFNIIEKGFCKGEFPYGFFRKFRFPENEWFGKSIYYVLRKK